MEEQAQPLKRRWYDKDPELKEALEVLRSAPKDSIDDLQAQVAKNVIEKIYTIMCEFHGKGRRWYDNDPIVIKAIEKWRVASPKTQVVAALKLLSALESNVGGGMELIGKDDD